MAINRLYAGLNRMLPAVDVIPNAGKAGGAAVSGDPVVCGQVPGVLVGDASSAGVGVMQTDGIFSLTVKGVDGSGNAAIAEGAILYHTAADAFLSAKTTGVRFGYALKGVASGATDTACPVRIGY